MSSISKSMIVFVASFAACGTHSVNTSPQAPVAVEADDGRAFTIPHGGRWWLGLQDAELSLLIDTALQENLQLKQSWARVRQAGALSAAAKSSLWPSISAQLEAGRSRNAAPMGSITSNSYHASAAMRYEIDVWGKARAGRLAAGQDLVASQADYRAAAITIAASVTERWFDILEQRAKRVLIADQTQGTEDLLALLERQYERNEANLSDVLQQDIQLRSLKLQNAQSVRDEKVAERQLALLLGRVPGEVLKSDRVDLPEPMPLPTDGIPIRFIRNRPDVQAAERRVVAADHRIGQAIADRFPSLTLTGSMVFSASTITNLFDTFVWNFLGSVGATLFDGGRRSAEVDRQKAVYDAALMGYGQTLISAMSELEIALIREKHQQEETEILELQVQSSERALESSRLRYQQGLIGYLSVLTSLQSVQNSQHSLLRSRRQLLSLRVQVYRSLGSGWTDEDETGQAKSVPANTNAAKDSSNVL